jgi:hypothetical protein
VLPFKKKIALPLHGEISVSQADREWKTFQKAF